jgi:hypothetical protein
MASSQTLSTTGVTTSPVKKPNNLQAVTIDDVKQFFFTYYREIWDLTKTAVKWIYNNWDKIAPIFDKGSAEYGKLSKSQKTQVNGYVAASIDAIKEGNKDKFVSAIKEMAKVYKTRAKEGTGLTETEVAGLLSKASQINGVAVDVKNGTIKLVEGISPNKDLEKDSSSVITNQENNSAKRVSESDQQSISSESTKLQSDNSEAKDNQSKNSELNISKSENSTTSGKESNTDVSKAIAAIKENADGIKQQYGLDVTTSEGLGKAVMIYWKENNLDPKTLKEQLPNMKGSDIDAALAAATENKTAGATKTKQIEVQRQ